MGRRLGATSSARTGVEHPQRRTTWGILDERRRLSGMGRRGSQSQRRQQSGGGGSSSAEGGGNGFYQFFCEVTCDAMGCDGKMAVQDDRTDKHTSLYSSVSNNFISFGTEEHI
jgi:hypothetical protein